MAHFPQQCFEFGAQTLADLNSNFLEIKLLAPKLGQYISALEFVIAEEQCDKQAPQIPNYSIIIFFIRKFALLIGLRRPEIFSRSILAILTGLTILHIIYQRL